MAAKIKTVGYVSATRSTQAACPIGDQNVAGPVGRTPWSAADALVGLCGPAQKAGQGAGCGPGGAPHRTAPASCESIFEGVSTRQTRTILPVSKVRHAG